MFYIQETYSSEEIVRIANQFNGTFLISDELRYLKVKLINVIYTFELREFNNWKLIKIK